MGDAGRTAQPVCVARLLVLGRTAFLTDIARQAPGAIRHANVQHDSLMSVEVAGQEIKIMYERQRFFGIMQQPLYQWTMQVCFDGLELSPNENSDEKN
ncbi:hypothetical protein WS67_20440 [Burkholderia singularis]|uniref:Uncharacterized protein n=2 Tax=Burkholderia singularis TaxID=1503053 RepID=A0A103DXC9_9BURK|nr:hypothetical protein WS67_20440 [Burkholderia singularis]